MEMLKRVYRYIFGPNLYRIHRKPDGSIGAFYYCPNSIEETAQKALKFASISKAVLTYTMPFWALFIYRRGYFTQDYLLKFARLSGWLASLLAGVLVCRGFGRSSNRQYVTFLNTLEKALKHPQNNDIRGMLRDYDFDFNYLPVDFTWEDAEGKKTRKTLSNWKRISSQHSNILATIFQGLPKEVLAYIISHTFGIRLLYPGSVQLLQAAMSQVLLEGRCTLVEQHDGERNKLKSEDGNDIDTMFVDRRRKVRFRDDGDVANEATSRQGQVLVICCEGNAGFYEVGCMATPLQTGFSVLGWNHPGFMHSSGQPFPDSDNKAMDVVMQFALHELKFPPKNIIVFAWSIGAFSAINAAIAYPDIRGIVLDSTFFDLMPFARRMMPSSIESLVHYTVRNYLNLHNCENLRQYKGAISFIRRDRDEVMNISGPDVVSSNLGNPLLEDFLRHRYPNLFEDQSSYDDSYRVLSNSSQSKALRQWLYAESSDARDAVLDTWDARLVPKDSSIFKPAVDSESFAAQLGKDLTPEQKTKVVLFLASKYMRHYNSTHCTPLPPTLFGNPLRAETLVNHTESSDSSDFELVH